MDSVPLVCITGQVRTAMIGTDAFQETDVFGVTLSLTKWSRLVRTIERNPGGDCRGILLGAQRKAGASGNRHSNGHSESQERIFRPWKFTPHARPAEANAEGAFSDTIVALLQRAMRPVALVGAGAKLSGAIPQLRRLLDDLNIPAFATVHGWAPYRRSHRTTWAWWGCTGREQPILLCMKRICCWFSERGLMIA